MTVALQRSWAEDLAAATLDQKRPEGHTQQCRR